MRIDSSGDVGIGTTAGFSSGNGLEIQRAGVATLRCDNSTSTAAGEFRADATGTAIDCRGLEVFRVLTGGAERMRIDSSGRVGIGTTSPTRPLDVEGVVLGDTFCSLRYDGVPTSSVPLDVDISKIATSIGDRSQSRTFEFTITEATGTAANLSRLFYVRLQEGTGFDISSAIYSFGSVSGTCTFSRPSALVWRISTSAGFMVVQGIFRKLSG